MNVSLTPELEKLVQAKVASGMYASASELVREALRLIEERDAFHAQRKAAMDAFIQEGMDSMIDDDGADPEVFWKEIDDMIDQMAAEKKKCLSPTYFARGLERISEK